MDTLVLEGKEFISTKRAAEITGYAKDYIGQLCREGRVVSRLIGRNWYILESSIREHRYGAESANATEESSDEEVAVDEVSDTAEDVEEAVSDPVEEETVEEAVFVSATEDPQEDSEAIEEIQRAWQSWFSNRYVEEKPATLTLSKAPPPEEPSEEVKIQRNVPEPVMEAEEAASIPIGRLPDRFAVHHNLPTHEVVSMRRGHRFVAAQEPSRVVQEEVQTTRVVTHKRGSGRLVLKAICIAVAGLSLAVAIVGAGALDSVPLKNPLQEQTMRYIGGTISF